MTDRTRTTTTAPVSSMAAQLAAIRALPETRATRPTGASGPQNAPRRPLIHPAWEARAAAARSIGWASYRATLETL